MKKIFAVLLFMTGIHGFGFPSAEAQTRAGDSAAALLGDLQDRGISKVGDLDLSALARRLSKEVEWNVTNAETPAAITGNRRSAYYLTQDHDKEPGKVFLSAKLPEGTLDSLGNLELHEGLGALGYNDQQYALSTALHVLQQLKAGAGRDALLKVYGSTLFKKKNMFASGGGGNSVGGGGDLFALIAKNQVLDEILRTEKVSADFLKNYPTVSFEPFYSKAQQFVALKYQFLSRYEISQKGAIAGVPITVNGQELISVYVPALTWQKGKQKRLAVIREIKKKLLELFPVSSDVPLQETKAYTCTGKPGLRFPSPSSSEVATIQQSRAAALTDCQDGFFVTGLLIYAPRFQEERGTAANEPRKDSTEIQIKKKAKETAKASDRATYACHLQADGWKRDFPLEIKKGQTAMSAWAMNDGYDLIMVALVQDKDGNPIETNLSVRDMLTKRHIEKHQTQKGRGPWSLTAKRRDGGKLTFSCGRS